ncbi:hypothetical protein [Rhodococcus qingshengii]|uniref:hypothetical protein n=1 Tax=Rhodococcus qingshengii TaxID=334542 RepID=UPI00399D6634
MITKLEFLVRESCSFGPAWTDDYDGPGGHDGCDSRNNVLAQQLIAVETKPGTRNCVVIAGTLQDSYTGTTIEFEKANASAVQIDHVISAALSRGMAIIAAQHVDDM